MKTARFALLALGVSIFVPAAYAATYRLAPYEGPEAIQTGQGGSKVSRGGIDFWLTGSPPGRFQILGSMHDEHNHYHNGSPGSSKVVHAIKSAGGNAAIINKESSQKRVVTFTKFGSNVVAIPVEDDSTYLIVVKYIDGPIASSKDADGGK